MKTINREKAARIIFINAVITFILSSLLAFCIDGYVRHPIPKQQTAEFFDISKTDTVYAEATVLDEEHAIHQFGDIFLVEWNGEIHLLYFKHHFQTGRHALISDVVLSESAIGPVNVGSTFEQVVVYLENSKIVNLSTGSMSVSFYYSIYVLIGMLFTLCESTVLWAILKKRIKSQYQ